MLASFIPPTRPRCTTLHCTVCVCVCECVCVCVCERACTSYKIGQGGGWSGGGGMLLDNDAIINDHKAPRTYVAQHQELGGGGMVAAYSCSGLASVCSLTYHLTHYEHRTSLTHKNGMYICTLYTIQMHTLYCHSWLVVLFVASKLAAATNWSSS